MTMMVEGHSLTMETNFGAAVSLVSEETVNISPFLTCLSLQQCDITYIYTQDNVLVKIQHDKVQETILLKLHTLPALQEVLDIVTNKFSVIR